MQKIFILMLSFLILSCSLGKSYKTANRESAGIAPDPATTKEAVILVYSADAWSWRGWFAVHTWIAVKRSNESAYTVYDVVGWRDKRGEPVLKIAQDVPDRHWFDAKPQLLKEHRGEGVDQLIDAVDQAARAYPWPTTYSVFPGPNSNTFVAWVLKEVPELEVSLPFSAIGSGYVD